MEEKEGGDTVVTFCPHHTVPKALLISEELQDLSLNIPLYFCEHLSCSKSKFNLLKG
jgi:hypothetical protein